MTTFRPLSLAFASALFASTPQAASEQDTQSEALLPSVTVTAEFRESNINDIPSSISVIGEHVIEQRNAQHLEEILSLAPNVNYASGASRARFYQIRGIGERSQFVEPLNPSVGLIIDDIDFSGLGNAGTLLDIDQVEVLRGPQGTQYGANALAGLINIKSQDPTDTPEARLEASVAEYDTYTLSAVVSGPLSDSLSYRLAIQQQGSDGYTENDFLNRDDTSDRDEQILRGKLRWNASDKLTIDTTLIYSDIDNGYDDFSLDNTRHTLSDEPGHDRQETTALGIKATYEINSVFNVEMVTSYVNSNIEYGYDEDWTYSNICAGQPCDGWEYSSFDNYIRDRQTATVDFRLVSQADGRWFNETTDWLFGLYYQDQSEDLKREYTYQSQDFISDYATDRSAVYGQLETHLSEKLTLITGLRLERYTSDYQDNDAVDFDHDEDLWGGRVALQYQLNDNGMIYSLVSRGFKTGGINSNPALPESRRSYDTEHMLNYELGTKWSLLDNTLQTQIALFYQLRDEVQVKQSILITNSDLSTEFIDSFDNAAKGNNYGLEAQIQWRASDHWQFEGSLGLLDTELKDFVNAEGDDLDGREQAHAPDYQFSLASTYYFTDKLSARLEVEGKDSFYFSDSHEERSDSYELWNANLTYTEANWQVALWGRNLLDEEYQVRGFSFPNDPRKFYITEPYYQYGEPRIIGVRGSYSF
ncbi:TonB-dependent receptor [Aestuariicella sp. G3-2]|uniref:TonB-dependent receptor n=1 Tax=Pseudomaricurvus albidus TaxID=2842452 RepID=UPI001C0DE0FD|nr:TonB-dependent receptor [Aestuariicella albida]MBU3071459.1 TonB-dependent receptor [Aestuariicella albida]